MHPDPGSLPRMDDGFRHRGGRTTRLQAFVDAAFAFAVTLLVISIDSIPDSIDALLLALRGVPAFAGAFLLIAMFWCLHVRWSRRFGLDDPWSTALGLLLVFLVLVYVYPLKLLAGLLFAWLSGGWLPAPASLDGPQDLLTVFIVYGVAFASLSMIIAALYAHALRRREALGLDVEEIAATAADVVAWRLAVAVGALSATVAAVLPVTAPGWAFALPGFVYFLMNLALWLAPRTYRRTRARLLAAGAGR